MSTPAVIAGLIVAVGFAGWRLGRRTLFFLHLLQLDGYKLNEYTRWLKANGRGLLIRVSHVLAGAVVVAALLLLQAQRPAAAATLVLIAWPIVFASSRRYRRTQTKKPLVFTDRMKRLIAATAVTALVIIAALLSTFLTSSPSLSGEEGFATIVITALGSIGLVDLLAPFTVAVAGLAMSPVEKRIQDGFKAQARARLAERPDLLVIGITGSYGKTSTKAAIASVLGHRQSVLASPGSYNTPMGLCKVINNMLKPSHQVLVLEMGARYKGDIRELCDLVTPKIGVVTSVGVAHLDTMGSQEAIAIEKGTLAEAIPQNGTTILNADDPLVLAMRKRTRALVITVGTNPDADVRAENIVYGADGTSFDVVDQRGERFRFATEVLGKHNVLNLLFAIAIGKSQGLRLREMAHAVRSMPAVEHRLKLRKEGDLLVLDDAFNSNPVGARNAVEILSDFDSGRRIVVTPGMVELGESQDDENRSFGAFMAGRVDTVLLVGERQSAPIKQGLLDGGFDPDQVHVFGSLVAARAYLRKIQRAGDIVLYENDLPDHLEEAA